MATKQSTIDFILDQLAPLDGAYARKMFGEYALYYEGKVAGLVCDDQLYIKLTKEGTEFVGAHFQEGQPFPGAKNFILIDGGQLEERDWLCELVRITADNVPYPKPKKSKKKPVFVSDK